MGSSKNCRVPSKWTTNGDVSCTDGLFRLSNEEGQSSVTLDYQRAEGGLPFLETSTVTSSGGTVEVEIIFSETFAGLQSATGKVFLNGKGCQFIEDKFTNSLRRRWTIFPLFKCYGYLPSTYRNLHTIIIPSKDSSAIRTALSEIPESCLENTQFHHIHYSNWIYRYPTS